MKLTPSEQHRMVAAPHVAHLYALALRLGVRDTRDMAALGISDMEDAARGEENGNRAMDSEGCVVKLERSGECLQHPRPLTDSTCIGGANG